MKPVQIFAAIHQLLKRAETFGEKQHVSPRVRTHQRAGRDISRSVLRKTSADRNLTMSKRQQERSFHANTTPGGGREGASRVFALITDLSRGEYP